MDNPIAVFTKHRRAQRRLAFEVSMLAYEIEAELMKTKAPGETIGPAHWAVCMRLALVKRMAGRSKKTQSFALTAMRLHCRDVDYLPEVTAVITAPFQPSEFGNE